MTPKKNNALELFQEVVANLSSPGRDLKRTMQLCQHACTLLDWPASEWFQKEIRGYDAGEDMPRHRYINGQSIWRTKSALPSDAAGDAVGLGPDKETEPVTMYIGDGVDRLIGYASTGTGTPTGATKDYEYRIGRFEEIKTAERVEIFEAATYRDVLNRLQNITFDFASDSCALLVNEDVSIPSADESGTHVAAETPPPTVPQIIIGSINDSPVQFGDGLQSVVYPPIDTDAIVDLMEEILESITALQLSDDEVAAATADIKTVQAQVVSPKPNRNIINESLKTLKTIIASAAGSGAAAALAEQLGKIHS